MDDRNVLRNEFSKLLQRAAEMKVTLDRMEGKIQGVPHYSLIEETAHELGREVSRMVQVMHFQAMVDECPQHGACPDCGKDVPFERRSRTVLSGDGPIELEELMGYCPCCRRAFFPSANRIGF